MNHHSMSEDYLNGEALHPNSIHEERNAHLLILYSLYDLACLKRVGANQYFWLESKLSGDKGTVKISCAKVISFQLIILSIL